MYTKSKYFRFNKDHFDFRKVGETQKKTRIKEDMSNTKRKGVSRKRPLPSNKKETLPPNKKQKNNY